MKNVCILNIGFPIIVPKISPKYVIFSFNMLEKGCNTPIETPITVVSISFWVLYFNIFFNYFCISTFCIYGLSVFCVELPLLLKVCFGIIFALSNRLWTRLLKIQDIVKCRRTPKRRPPKGRSSCALYYCIRSASVSCVGFSAANEVSDKHLDNLMEEAEDCRPYTVSVAGAGATRYLNVEVIAAC